MGKENDCGNLLFYINLVNISLTTMKYKYHKLEGIWSTGKYPTGHKGLSFGFIADMQYPVRTFGLVKIFKKPKKEFI